MGNAIKRKTADEWKHVRNMRHFNADFLQARCLKVANTYTYQQWENYPESPALLEIYPYQCIVKRTYFTFNKIMLVLSTTPLYLNDHNGWLDSNDIMLSYYFENGGWGATSGWSYIDGGKDFYESNQDIYWQSGLLYLSKTIEPSNEKAVFDVRCNI